MVDGSNRHISVIGKTQYDKTPLNGLDSSNLTLQRNDLNKLQLPASEHEYEDPDKLKQSKLPTTEI